MKVYIGLLVMFTALLSACGGSSDSSPATQGTSRQEQVQALGKKVFFDTRLSSAGNQACASCHDPLAGFADPEVSKNSPVSEGSEAGSFGNRNAPTAAYAFFVPSFTKTATDTTKDGTTSNYLGGQFLDGRRPNLKEQAKDPFLNPREMNNSNAADVVSKVSSSDYAGDFTALFGNTVFDDVDNAYEKIAMVIAAFEASDEVNPFSSKFDDVMAGTDSFSASEQRGFNLFKGTKAKCANCHVVPDSGRVLFTNHRYYNIGTPPNAFNPALVADSSYVDKGLAENTSVDAGDIIAVEGKFRTPTLRNIALTAPYMHNGVYATLEEVIDHYDFKLQNLADGNGVEVNRNIAIEVAFDDYAVLGLSPTDKADLVNFMKTLTDK